MSGNRFSASLLITVVAAAITGCSSSAPVEPASMASTITFDDQWATSAETGMAAVFGTLTNSSGQDATIVSGESPASATVQLHEVTPDAAGNKTMRPKEGGITVTANSSKELAPGGDHLMLMELTQPLRPGAEVDMTVTFSDGSTLPITAQIRDFAGGDEEYSPGPHGHG